MNKKYALGFVFVLFFLTSCFPQAIVRNGELKAIGVFRNQSHEFNCDPAKAALASGVALNLSRRPVTFSCGAMGTQSILTVTMQDNDAEPIQVLWNVQDPTTGGIVTLNSNLASRKRFSNNGYLLLDKADYSGTFEFQWSDFAVLRGTYRLTTQ